MPLTAVGKVFKPALRWDAAQRAVTQLLADLQQQAGSELTVEVGAHAVHGSWSRSGILGIPEAEQAALAQQVEERVGRLELHHQVVFAI